MVDITTTTTTIITTMKKEEKEEKREQDTKAKPLRNRLDNLKRRLL
jgi:hypothetical protein